MEAGIVLGAAAADVEVGLAPQDDFGHFTYFVFYSSQAFFLSHVTPY